METLADYGVVGLFNYNTFTTAIYSAWIDFRSVEVAAQLASILVISAFFLIYFEKKARGKAKYYSSDIYQERPYKASGLLGGLISFFVLGVFLLAFAMPMLQLVIWGHEMILEEWNTSYLDLIQSTITLTTLAIIIVIFISTLLALPNDCKNSLVSRNLLRVSTLGYALPGSVMAVGLLFGVNEISSFAQIFGLPSINYLIFGSITLLVFAYVTRFLAVGFNSIDASVQQIKPVLIDNARLLGAKRGKIIWSVYLPMMLPGILAASLLVGVDVMKELPATYLLRPFGWDTLAIKVYELSSEGLYERAAVPALIMVAIGALMMLIFRSIDKKITL
jgi:iron(III) transport system permease protein